MENLCSICPGPKEPSELFKLKCNHQFCWICINKYLKENLSCKIECPLDDCHIFIRDAEIRRVLSGEDIEQYENICLGKLTKSHKCLLPQCGLSVTYTDRDVQYSCENCTLYNCIQCQASHSFTSCSDYQSKSPNTKHRICQEAIENAIIVFNNRKRNEYREILLKIDEMDICSNDSVFTCELCYSVIGKGDGVKLQNCHHNLCKTCLISAIVERKKIPVSCPYCNISLNDREIQSILTKDQLLNYQEMCRNYAKRSFNHFQCQTVDCDGFYEISKSTKEFICNKCGIKNCVQCRAVHPNETCDQYQIRMKKNPGFNPNEEQTKTDNKMMCLICRNYITKTKGCNWIQCPNCSTELCWIRKMLRWGPKGRGDESGGCKCMVNGIPCDPNCTSSCSPHNFNFLISNRRSNRVITNRNPFINRRSFLPFTNNRASNRLISNRRAHNRFFIDTSASNSPIINTGASNISTTNTSASNPLIINTSASNPLIINTSTSNPHIINTSASNPPIINTSAFNISNTNISASSISTTNTNVFNTPIINTSASNPATINTHSFNRSIAKRRAHNPHIINTSTSNPPIINTSASYPFTTDTSAFDRSIFNRISINTFINPHSHLDDSDNDTINLNISEEQ